MVHKIICSRFNRITTESPVLDNLEASSELHLSLDK